MEVIPHAVKGHGGYSACGKRSWRLFRMR